MGKRSKARADKLADGAEVAAAPTVAPLHCPSCSAPVPLGDGDVATCAACQATVPIPDNLRALRATERERTADRAEAERLYAKLGSPPSWGLRAWAKLAGLAGTAIAGVFAVLVAIGGVMLLFAALGLELLSHWVAPAVHVDLVDRYGGGTAYMMFVGALLVFGMFPNWLVGYLDSAGELRHTLQVNLAARAPARKGFPATCRSCGAALDVPAGAYGVRCVYCQTDNLVALPAAWVGAAGKRQQRFHRSIVDAAARATELRGEALGRLKSGAIAGVVFVAFCGVVGRAAVWIDRDYWIVDYSASMGPPRVLAQSDPDAQLREGELGPTESLGGVALRRGEVFELTSPDAGACVTVVVRNSTSFPFLRLDQELTWSPNTDGTLGTRFTAPYTGLFVMDVQHATYPSHMRWQIGAHATPGLPAAPPGVTVPPAVAPSADVRAFAARFVRGGGVAAAESPDGKYVVAVGNDGVVVGERPDPQYPRAPISTTPLCTESDVTSVVFLSPTIAALRTAKGIEVWNVTNGMPMYRLPAAR